MFARKRERLSAITRSECGVAVCLEKIAEELHVELVVLHNQDGFGHPRFPYPLYRRKLNGRKNHLRKPPLIGKARPDFLRKGKLSEISTGLPQRLSRCVLGFATLRPLQFVHCRPSTKALVMPLCVMRHHCRGPVPSD